MSRLKDFFENFRATAARKRAVAAVKKAERNLGRRIKYWERRQMEGIHAIDPRRNVSDMTTNQLKAYARELNGVRFANMKAAGISAPGGELLDLDTFSTYSNLWEAREQEKKQALKQLKLKGIPLTPKVALLNINPVTGELQSEYGGSLVLTPMGSVQIPTTKETLERRIGQMQHWKSISERIEISNSNVAAKLAVIDPGLVDKWNALSNAQKQHLINNEGIFDFLNAFTFSTKDSEVRAFMRAFPELSSSHLDHLYDMITNASSLEEEYHEG